MFLYDISTEKLFLNELTYYVQTHECVVASIFGLNDVKSFKRQ